MNGFNLHGQDATKAKENLILLVYAVLSISTIDETGDSEMTTVTMRIHFQRKNQKKVQPENQKEVGYDIENW
jgi:hypothetical protein